MARHQAIDVGSGRICLEWVFRPWRWLGVLGVPQVGIVRAFPGMLGAIDPKTGQPLREWEWSCVCVVRYDVMKICSVFKMPRFPTVGELRASAASLKMRWLEWERLVEGRWYPVRCPLSPCSLPVLTYPG